MFRYLIYTFLLAAYFTIFTNDIVAKAMVNPIHMASSADDLALDIQLQDTAQVNETTSCRQIQCPVWARVSISTQRLYLYLDGVLTDTFKVTTGDKKHPTPSMDRHPSGPTYVKYTSKKFPGGNYMGLGNMPYVVFIRGGYAIHGTTPGNFKKLGSRGSHGCIRLHPSNAKIFFDLVRKMGLQNVWVTIEQ